MGTAQADWDDKMRRKPMDAAERAHRLLTAQGDNTHARKLELAVKALSQAEQAVRQDERRKVLEEAGKIVLEFDLDGLEAEIASSVRALAEEVT